MSDLLGLLMMMPVSALLFVKWISNIAEVAGQEQCKKMKKKYPEVRSSCFARHK